MWRLDFVGVGAARSGTTWVYNVARQHPDILMAEPKEVHFFNERSWSDRNTSYDLGMEYYRSYWPKDSSGKCCGEVSPTYLYSEKAAHRLREAFPEVKVIITLRDPIERTYSHYYLATRGAADPPSFEEALERMPYLIDASKYAAQVQRFLDVFPREQVLILLLEDIEADPLATARRIYRFLGVRDDVSPDTGRQNVTYAVRSRALKVFLRECTFFPQRVFKLLMAKHLLPTSMGRWLASSRFARYYEQFYARVGLWNMKPARKEPLNVKTRKRLREEFRKDVQRLSVLIDRDLSHWL